MITDLVQIKILGEKKREENTRLRIHMKSRDYSDRILRRTAEAIEDAIDCTTCANCCRVATAKVTERDIDRLLMEETGLPVIVAEDPLTCVARGCGLALERMDKLGSIFASD